MGKTDSKLLSMVAELYYMNNQGQKDIAELAGISQAKVSRLLTEARERGIVRITVSNFEPRAKELEEELKCKLNLHDAVIIKSAASNYGKSKRSMGYFAAPVVEKLIQPDSIVCVSAGRQIAQMIKDMKPVNAPGVSVIHTMGNIGSNINEYDAIEIARKLAQLCGGRLYQLQAPAIAETIEEKKVFIGHKQIQATLAKLNQAALAIIGVGILSDSLFADREFIKSQDSERLKKKGVVGEICGRFFDENGNECDTEYKDRVISMSLEQLRQTPEVIAVTSGVERARAILSGIRGGMIKMLISNEVTAREILGLL